MNLGSVAFCSITVALTLVGSCTDMSSTACASTAVPCPSGCPEIEVFLLDETRGCKVPAVIGCREPGAQTSDAACAQNVDDGRIVFGSGSTLDKLPRWAPCTPENGQRARLAPHCRDVQSDAASDAPPADSGDDGAVGPIPH